jgi:hypothetical protein
LSCAEAWEVNEAILLKLNMKVVKRRAEETMTNCELCKSDEALKEILEKEVTMVVSQPLASQQLWKALSTARITFKASTTVPVCHRDFCIDFGINNAHLLSRDIA